jgi:hypothetical protein
MKISLYVDCSWEVWVGIEYGGKIFFLVDPPSSLLYPRECLFQHYCRDERSFRMMKSLLNDEIVTD